MNKQQVFDISPEEIQRYSRHLVIPELGLQGQMKLKNASVLIVGCGGLGSPIALYLAAMGIGRIGIVDYDKIEISNLQRQVIYNTNQIGSFKAKIARDRLLSINPEIQVDIYEELFSSQNAEKIATPYNILIDGTDNIPTRYLLNDLCVFTRKPFVYGAVYRFEGQLGILDASRGACYRCIFPTPPSPESIPNCSITGVVGVIPGIIGLLQAIEVVKLILNIGTPLLSKLLIYDALECKMQTIQLPKNPKCKVCNTNPEITTLIDYEHFCGMPIRNQEIENDILSITPSELKKEIDKNKSVRLIDLRDPVELQISQIAGTENVPFHLLQEEMRKWDKQQYIILICHIGFLSNIAKQMLIEAGFTNVRNLKGGMLAWARDIDHTMPQY